MPGNESRNNTRTCLIEAGLHLFGQKGFEGTSTRELAGLAKTNVASITYHFGSKAGLRSACATEVAARVSNVLDGAGLIIQSQTAKAATAQIERLIGALIDLIVGAPQAQDMVAFMLRELTEPGEVADTVYASFIDPRHKALCDLWATATGRDPDDEGVKLAIFALIGQVLYFRIASGFVSRRMSWDNVGLDEVCQIKSIIIANLHDAIERQRL